MSRYHQLPRDSVESDEAREFLIPSPASNVIDASTLTAGRSCSITFHPSVMIRIITSILSLVGLLIARLDTPFHPPMVSAVVFFSLIVITNTLKLVIMLFTFTSPLRIAILYKNRELFARSERPVKQTVRPSFGTYFHILIDAAWSIGLMVSLICFDANWPWYEYWSTSGAIAACIIGYIVVVLQAINAIPFIDRVGFTVRGSLRPKPQHIFLGPDVVQPAARGERKEASMSGAVEVVEETAIPPSPQTTEEARSMV